MTKYKAYPEYKDSGVESFGCIPKKWSVLRLKYIFEIKKRIAGTLGFDILSVTQKGVKIKDIDSGEGQLSMDYSKYQRVLPGEFAMNHMDLLTGYVDISKYDGVTSPDYRVFSVRDNNDFYSRYFLYLLQDGYKQRRFFHLGQGSAHLGRWRLPTEAFNEIIYPLPSLEEQIKIADFLDYETAKIDNLIGKQNQLIELLKEKRQAVISHAVTKGLNPDVTMKDSGVEWLGEVPEHWEVKRIKHFGKVIGGFAFKSTDFTDEGYPVIKISNVSHLSFDWGDSSFLPPSFSFTHKEYLAPNGALVFAMTRPVISGGIKITLLDDDSAPLVNQRVGFMMVKSKNMARYILISTQSSAFLAQFVNNMTVTNQPNISSEGIESIYLPVPPMSEISRILLYVDRMNESYNQLIDKALLQVSLLQERRTALISAAVTGKIDVRGWVAPDTQDVEEPQEATA